MLVTKKILSVPYSRYDKIQSNLRKKRREVLIFLEHTSCITGGINYNIANLLVSEGFLKKNGVDIHFVKRGGDFTAHEKGQLVIYPHIDLKKRNLTITDYLDIFMNSIRIAIKSTWGLEVIFKNSEPGLYLENNPVKKLASTGVYFKSFFTSFGAAINIRNDLKTFSYINPCGKKSENMISIGDLGLDTNKESEFLENFLENFLKNTAI